MKFFITIITLLVCISAGAQRIVSGTVTDVAGEGIMGAAIQIKGTNTGVVTDFDGRYSIEVSDDSLLVFSSIGYTTKEITVTNGVVVVNVTLEVNLENFILIGPCFPPRYQTNVTHGLNYKTTGIHLSTNSRAIFQLLDASLSYATDFEHNDNLKTRVNKWFGLYNSFDMEAAIDFQHANFDSLQLHRYTASLGTNIKIFEANRTNISLESGVLNYKFTDMRETHWGYGIHLKRPFDIKISQYQRIRLNLNAGLINWNEFTEKQLGAALEYNRFLIGTTYQKISDYEETTVFAGYGWYF